MSARTYAPALCFAIAISGAFAQTTETQKPPAPATEQPKPVEQPKPAATRETPPDMKAYQEAGRITDPEKKIAALEKWKKDFPNSTMLEVGDSAILSTLVQKFPAQTKRIRQQAAMMYRAAPEKNRGSAANTIALQFLNGDLLLKEAQGYAKKGVDSMRLSSFLAEQLAGYEKRKQKPPSPQELQKRFLESRAVRIATLGRIEVKLGHTAKGQKLLEEAYAVSPSNVTVGAALGELAAKAGNDDKALQYLIPVRLAGNGPKTAAAALEAAWRKRHNGSLDGLEAMLDTEYHKRFPNPVKVEPYKPAEKRSDRVVLAEVFTGSGCPPCAGADVAFDAAMERYARKDLAVVMYHVHVPRPDPMTNLDTQARSKNYGVTGVPTFAIDGKKTVGGGARENAKDVYGRFQKDLEKDLETPAEAHFSVGVNLTGGTVSVNVVVNGIESESKDLKLQIALVEKELRYNGENGIRFHPMVVRAMAGDKGEGFALSTGVKTFSQSFDIDEVSKGLKAHLDDYEAKGHRGESFTFLEKKYQIDRRNLAIVAFVQDDKTKHVLQAAYVDLSPEGGTRPVTEPTELR